MLANRNVPRAVLVGLVLAHTTAAMGNVNLCLVATTPARVGDTVDVNLVVSSDNAGTQLFTAVDAILNWDPADLLLVGFSTAHQGYAWFAQGFLNNPDGINANVTDGDAMYTALAVPGQTVAAPAAGLVVTTFQFRLLRQPSAGIPPSSAITLRASQGQYSHSRVYGTQPGSDVTGALCSTAVQLCAQGDEDGNGTVDAADLPTFVNVLLGLDTIPLDVFRADANCDGSTDGLDIQAFVNQVVH